MTEEKEKKPFRLTEEEIAEEEREAKGKGEDWGTADFLFTKRELSKMRDATPSIPPALLRKAMNEANSKAESGSKISLPEKQEPETPKEQEPEKPEERDPDFISNSEAVLQEFAPKSDVDPVNKNNAVDSLEGSDFYFSNGYEPIQESESTKELLASAVGGSAISLRELTRRINNASPKEARNIHDALLHQGYSPALLGASLDVKSEVRDGKARVTASFDLEKALAGASKQIDLIRALKKVAGNRARIELNEKNGLLNLMVSGEVPEEHDLRGLLHPESEHLRTMRSLLKVADEHACSAMQERH